MLIKLQGYVLREVVKILLLAIAGVCALILLAMCVRLMREGLKPVQLQGILLYLFPFTLPFAVPCGILIASVMAFGRLSGDNELLAIRSSGVNLWSVVWPVLALGLLLSAGAELVDNSVLPWCQRKAAEQRRALIGPWLELLGSGAQTVELPPYEIHIGAVDPGRPALWQSVVAVKYADDFVAQIIQAKTGSCTYDPKTQIAVMTLTNGYMIQPLGEGRESYVSFTNDMRYVIDLSKDRDAGPLKNSQLSLEQLMTRRAGLTSRLKGEGVGARLRAEKRGIGDAIESKDKELNQLLLKQKPLGTEIEGLGAEFARMSSQKTMLEARKKTAEDDAAEKRKLLALTDESMAEIQRTIASLPVTSQRRRELGQRLAGLVANRADMAETVTKREGEIIKAASELTAAADALAKNRAKAQQLGEQKAELDAAAAARSQERLQLRRRMQMIETEEQLLEVETQIHFRLAQGAACFVFALLGIPLGIMARRGGVMVPFGISFAVVICLYYPIYTLGRQMSQSGFIPAYFAMWLPNAVCGILGVVLLVRTLRR